MALSSGIFKKYKKKFVLDEDGLRRVEAVLLKAIDEQESPLELLYRVEREDDRFYETHNVADVLGDANIIGKKVKSLGIELVEKGKTNVHSEEEKETFVRIIFDKEIDPPYFSRDVIVQVSSVNRTWALMLADELETQISRLFKVKTTPKWVLSLVFVLFILLFYKIGEFTSGAEFEPQKNALRSTVSVALGAILTYLVSRIMPLPRWARTIIGAQSVFLWGEEESEYADRERLRRNIQWTIVGGFIASFLAGLALLAM